MNKQSISFKADEQKLVKTGGIEHYASNIVAYIEATFDLGANWNGYDSVRAVWSNDYLTDISTVLDNNGKCIVPTEVLTDTGNVTVNLVGSIADGDTLTDRLTTYPCKAVIVDADAKVEGDETESITPSQFEQFVEIVHDEVEQVTGMTAEAETLPAGSDATASYSDGVLSFGIPRGDKGEQGEQGETGHTGQPAGFGDVTASVDNTVGTPSVNVTASGPDTAKEFDFEFHNLKGEQGDTGETGETGNGIASTVLNPDYTLTITFTDGTSYTTPSIRGAKGDTGNTGATGNGIQSTVLNADYTLTITFTDGTSYTTPSIRGEQGPAGPVSDVTVNGTSVVDQNGVAVITMPELVKTVQGNPIVLDDAFGEVKNLTVELLPIQEGSGTPSPQNVRPITGHDSVTVGVTDGDSQSQSKTVTLPHTVYGAGVGVTSGSGKEKMAIVDLGTFTWSAGTDSIGQYFYTAFDQYKTLTTPTLPNAKCSIYPFAPSSNVQDKNIAFAQGVPKRIYIRDTSYATAADFKTAMSGVQLCYELNAYTDLSTDPTSLTLYNGDNVISSDGDMELTYVQDMATVIRKIENQL